MKIVRTNQSGATAIILTMFFIMIVSLIVIAFATIIRREQIATLESNLSTQAQLTAESGVNLVKSYFEKELSSSGAIKDNSDCIPSGSGNINDFVVDPMNKIADNTGTKISCLKWDSDPPSYEFNVNPYSSNSFILPNDKFENAWNHIYNITWQSELNTAYDSSTLDTTKPTHLPDINTSNASIIKLVTASFSEITNYEAIQVVYLVPYNGTSVIPACTSSVACPGGVDLGNHAIGTLPTAVSKGLVYYVPCSGGICNVNVYGTRWSNVPSLSGPQGMYFENLGASNTSITFTPQGLTTGPILGKPLSGVVAKVDSNAVVQDVSKRVIAYLPMQQQSWQPNFAVFADSLCKNYKVDGALNASPAPGSGSFIACPS